MQEEEGRKVAAMEELLFSPHPSVWKILPKQAWSSASVPPHSGGVRTGLKDNSVGPMSNKAGGSLTTMSKHHEHQRTPWSLLPSPLDQ